MNGFDSYSATLTHTEQIIKGGQLIWPLLPDSYTAIKPGWFVGWREKTDHEVFDAGPLFSIIIPLLVLGGRRPMIPTSKGKIVRCVNCRGMMRVPMKALSVFCPHCQKRAELENLRITGSHPGRRLATCGDIVVEATGWLNAEVVAENVLILGRVRGPVTAAKSVEVGPKGHVIGDISSPKIVVREGAVIQGSCRMTTPAAIHELPASTEEHSSSGESTFDRAALPNLAAEEPSVIRIRPLPLRPPSQSQD
jgi:cytoskeletal protein CcmA (bactofilin family)